MPPSVNVTLRWERPGQPTPIAASIGAATAAGLPTGVAGSGTVGAPVLISPPSIYTFFAGTATTQQLLGVNVAQYEKDMGVEFTGTVSAGDCVRLTPTTASFYIGSNPSASSNNNEYQYWYLFADGVPPYGGSPSYPGYNGIYSYDGATKRVTVNWGSDSAGNPNMVPTIGGTWKLVKNYPVARKVQWKRNGVPILGAETRGYSVTPADVGQSITYEETAAWIDWTYNQIAPGTLTPPLPSSPSTTVSSAPYVPTSAITSATKICSADDFTYLGSFRVALSNPGARISVIPASQSQNGQISLIALSNANSCEEISIPALVTNSNPNSLNLATVNRTSNASNVMNGWLSTSVNGWDTDAYLGGGTILSGTSNLVAGGVGFYTYDRKNYFIKRPSNIQSTTTANPFVVVPTNQDNRRWASGNVVEIPTALRSGFGGDLMITSGIIAIDGNNSVGPSGMVINSADIDGASAKYTTGTAQSGSTTTAILDASANSSTPDYYKDWQVVFNIGGSVAGNQSTVTAYNQTTKQITFSAIGTAVTNGSTYKLVAPVYAKQLFGRNTSFEASTSFPIIWAPAQGSFTMGMFIPRGTTSVICVTTAFRGMADYGQDFTYPDNTGRSWGGLSQSLRRLYQQGPISPGTQGPRASSEWRNDTNNFWLFWVYDASDLNAVASGSKTYEQVYPFAVFSFMLPYGGQNTVVSVAFDNDNNRLYVFQEVWMAAYGTKQLVHVYSCNKYV